MLPIAVAEVLAEGLVYFRRILSLYDASKKALKITDMASALFDKEIRYHRTILGEDAYFFILGRRVINWLYRSGNIEHGLIDVIVLKAIYQSLSNRPTADAKSCVIEFAYDLGQQLQLEFGDCYERCQDYLSSGDGTFVLKDPVYDELISGPRGLPAPTEKILLALGVPITSWTLLVDNVSSGRVASDWLSSISVYDYSPVVGHRNSNFIGLIARGASSAMYNTSDLSVDIVEGPDALSLSLMLLPRAKPSVLGREPITDNRGITRQMVDSASLMSMANRGFVNAGADGWIHFSEAMTVYDDNLKKEVIKKRVMTVDLDSDIDGSKASSDRQKVLDGIKALWNATSSKFLGSKTTSK